MKVTIIQTNLAWENKSENLSNLKKIISNIDDDTDLIILPEMFSTAFTMNAKTLAETMNGHSMLWLKNIALATGFG